MKYPLSWATAVLAVLLQLHSLCLGGAVSVKRKQPQASVVRKLRDALDSRTEELTQQKNIAHGLELEVRELQSELQAEKKALATESQKEQTLQQKLNRVRAVLDDGPSVKASSKKLDKGSANPTADRPAPPAATPVLAPLNDVSVSAPTVQEALEPLPNVPDSELESSEELPPQQASSKPSVAVRQLTSQATPAFEEPAPVAHSRQTTPQEPPPFFEAAALQSSSVVKNAPVKHAAAAPKAKAPKHQATHGARNVGAPHHAPKVAATKATRPLPSPLLRGSEPMAKVATTPANAKPDPEAALPSSTAALRTLTEVVQQQGANDATQQRGASEANTAASAKDSDSASGPTSDFDALEAQLHEEDRRIQDLDRENALDAMTDGGVPAAPGSSPPATNNAPVKTSATQPKLEKLELDSEGPMEDFLNVEAPGPESGNEAAPPVSTGSAATTDASLSDAALALPQVAEGVDGALSDNQFLAQIAPAPRRG